jgi:hypothetical protein
VKDATFITTAENISECHTEMENAMEKRIAVTKERIQLQEETLSLNMAAEEAIENHIEVQEKELRPLMKRKRNLQMDIFSMTSPNSLGLVPFWLVSRSKRTDWVMIWIR